MAKKTVHDWVTAEMFDEVLAEILEEKSTEELFAIPVLYEALSDYFHDEVLEALEEERGDEG